MAGSITPLPVMLDEEDRKRYENLEPPKSLVVRYGYQKLIAELPYDGQAKPGCGSKLVVCTDRGVELGEMLTSTCPNAGCAKSVTRKEMLSYIENSGGKDYPFSEKGKILRVATPEDLSEQARLDAGKPDIIRRTRQLVREMDLPMRLVEVERLLGGERMIFYYTSEDWVDFRGLVKRLAGEYQTRIEMHQVNAREEARLVADYEKCGQHCCCKQFLKVLKPVSMKSAKVQKATLDPMKISGRCGRLMCCLRYEDKTYAELKKNLPRRKSLVETEDGVGLVLDTQILTQLVLVQVGRAKPAAYPVEQARVLTSEEASEFRARQKEEQEAWASRRGSSSPSRDRKEEAKSNGEKRSRSTGRGGKGGSDKPQKPDTKAGGDAADKGAGSGDAGGKGRRRRRRRRRRRGRGGSGGSGGSAGGKKPDGDS
ncbi:MAG: stage 0 sporulation family protein [Phycisphaeraceae bacterium]